MTSPPQPSIRTPEEILGFRPGDQRRLATWEKLRGALDELAERSDSITRFDIGTDWAGRSIPAYIVASPATQFRLQEYQQRSVNDRENLDKKVVLITAGVHATEVGGPHAMPRLLHELISSTSEFSEAIREKIITILVPSLNPSGFDLVQEWYRKSLGTPYEGTAPPFPEHPVGHDINRDWVLLSQPETQALHRSVLRAWRPHVHLDLHEMQTHGPRYCLPPYLDPVDPFLDPSVIDLSTELGLGIAEALRVSGKRGVATRTFFDAFSPSRSYVNHHGGIRILAEAAAAKLASTVEVPRTNGPAGGPPSAIVSIIERRSSWNGGPWSFDDVVDLHYQASVTLLKNVAQSDGSGIREHQRDEKENRPSWLVLPYILQKDPASTRALVDILLNGEVRVEKVDSPVFLNGAQIPAGGFHIRADQPFIGYADTLLEATDYPGDHLSTSAHVHVPYDVTSHSLPLLMGVDVVKLPAGLPGAGESISSAPHPVGWINGSPKHERFIVPATANVSATIVNACFRLGADCARLTRGQTGIPGAAPGSFIIRRLDRRVFEEVVRNTGLQVQGVTFEEDLELAEMHQPKVGIYRGLGGEFEDAGWTSHVLDGHGFEPRILSGDDVRAGDFGDLSTVILPSQRAELLRNGPSDSTYPLAFRAGIGRKGVSELQSFVWKGGTVIALGAACDAALAMFPSSAFNSVGALPNDHFQTPGALLQLELKADHEVTWGLESPIAAMVTNSPVFSTSKGGDPLVSEIARYPLGNPLLAGWIRGSEHLAGRSAAIEIRSGRGKVYLFGFRPQFRGMAHGTFRLLFNAIFASATAGLNHR